MIKTIYTFVFTTILLTQSAFAQYCSGTLLKTAATGTFNDGSGTGNNYADNSNCQWLIQPVGAATITLDFIGVFDLELYNCSDKIIIYDGSDTSATVLGTFCGNANLTPPAGVTSTGGSMLVRFTSDGSYNNGGWEVSYTSTTAPPVYCSGSTYLTQPSGTFEDGSGSDNYSDNANCIWYIEPLNASSISLTFTAFNTQGGMDFVKVYDNYYTPVQIGSFSGSSIPSVVTLTGGYMMVEFTSNASITDLGWAASYTSVSTTDIVGKELLGSVAIYPNPFHQTATLQFSVPEAEACELIMYDIIGKVIKNISIPPLTSSLVIDAKSLPTGMYFYTITKNNMPIHNGKMIIE